MTTDKRQKVICILGGDTCDKALLSAIKLRASSLLLFVHPDLQEEARRKAAFDRLEQILEKKSNK